jgi:hypothetical protein
MQDFSLLRGWSRGTGYELRFPGRAVDVVQLRRPADRHVHGPLATGDAHIPLPRLRDDSESGGRRDVGRTIVCWAGDGADRHPRDVAG